MENSNKSYEFGFMDTKEKVKLLVLKFISLAWIFTAMLEMIYEEDLSYKCAAATGLIPGVYLYFNLYFVKSEVMELFEPPYPTRGNGRVFIGTFFLITSIYYQLNWQ